LIGDINHDGRVDGHDLALVIQRLFWETDTPKNPNADANGDGAVTAGDLVTILSHFH